MKIVVSGNLSPEVQPLIVALKKLPNATIESRLLDESNHELLDKNGPLPDVVIHYLGADPERELIAFVDMPARLRPALLLVGQPGGDKPEVLRLAMKAGARDYLDYATTSALQVEERVKALLMELVPTASATQSCSLTAFISPKGGGGASMVAESVAHALAARYGQKTLLIDLDCQFGTQYLNLDLKPDKGMKEALEAVDTLDEVALKGYVGQHPSGLHVLGTLPSQILLPGEITEKHMTKLMELLMGSYEQIIVDMPCTIDSTFSLIVERMRRIVMVVQQDFQNIRNAQKLNHILRDELQVPSNRTAVVVNRYEANNPITIRDVEGALQLTVSGIIPSDFRSVNDAANLGTPLLEHSPQSTVSASILDLSAWVAGKPPPDKKPQGMLAKIRSVLSEKA